MIFLSLSCIHRLCDGWSIIAWQWSWNFRLRPLVQWNVKLSLVSRLLSSLDQKADLFLLKFQLILKMLTVDFSFGKAWWWPWTPMFLIRMDSGLLTCRLVSADCYCLVPCFCAGFRAWLARFLSVPKFYRFDCVLLPHLCRLRSNLNV